jgi:hypothetical protein
MAHQSRQMTECGSGHEPYDICRHYDTRFWAMAGLFRVGERPIRSERAT